MGNSVLSVLRIKDGEWGKMSRLIDAEKLDLVSYQGIPNGYKDSFDSGVLYAMNLIDDQPTVDAVPVIHGHWIKIGNQYSIRNMKCSICGEEVFGDVDTEKYCFNCGAKNE